MNVNILGTEYTVETRKISEDPVLEKNRFSGYCAEETKLIVVADMREGNYLPDMNEEEQEIYRKKVLRHEITHAFLNESGLSDNTTKPNEGWAKCEEVVDWIAIQFPKMLQAFKTVNAI